MSSNMVQSQNDVLQLLDSGQFTTFKQAINTMPTADISELLEDIDLSQTLLVFRMLTKENAVHVFAMLSPEKQENIIKSITDKEIKSIMDDLWLDDIVDMLEEFPANLVKKILHNSSPDVRNLVNQFLNYPESSVGSIMTAEFIELKKDTTVKEAIKILRDVDQRIETIYVCFITDSTRILQGVIELKDLLIANDDDIIENLIEPKTIAATTSMDKEDAARLLMTYDLISLPVVDTENRLVGIVTIDDAVDVMVEEDTEDIEKMAGISPSERPYLQTNSWILAKNRLPWLILGLFLNMFVTFTLNAYSPIYVIMPVLVSFIPMLMGTGGNAGSQTSTTVIRGIAINEIAFKDFGKVITKEAGVSLVIGAVLGIFTFLRIFITNSGNYLLAIMVSLSLLCAIVVGKIVGAMLPLLAHKLKLDPALMAAPLVTTVVDILTIIVYFNIAKVFFTIV